MELRPGYKQTEVGILPGDWEVVPLGTLVRIISGDSPSHFRFLSSGVPYYKVEQLSNSNKYLHDGSTPYHFTDGQTVPAQSVIFAKRGAAIALNKIRILRLASFMDTNLMALTPSDLVEAEYLYYALGHIGLWQFADTTSVPQINNKHINPLLFPLPQLPEQRALVAALSDVDALLEEQTRLIAKKRDIKQAAMQQLLTGRIRLPGFDGEWQIKRLDDIGDIRSGGTPSTAQAHFWNGDIPWCTPTDITALEHRKYLTETARTISAAGLQSSSAEVIPPHSVIMTSRATIGECAINLIPITTNQGFKNIVPFSEVDVEFLYYVMTTQKNGLIAQCGGSTFLEIGKKQLRAYAINLPKDKDEQTAIATSLSDMDAELVALEARRDKTRALKRAMMQELLTGRTRLVVPAITESRKDSERTDGRRANIHFMRSVLAAEIIDRLHDEPTFGHVKFEKMIFLVEHLCDVDTGSAYHRDAAGPYDNRAIRSIDSQLRKQKWFDAQKIEGRYRYEPMANRGKHKEYFERYYSGIRASFDRVIDAFRDFRTEKCEMVATLFAAWNDLLSQNGEVSDDAIVHEVLNNWHESKKRIPEDRWHKALSWMRDHGFVPRNASGAA